MGEQIIQQPDGLLAVWSTNVDDWVIFDATPDDLVERAAEYAADEARRTTQTIIDRVLDGSPRPYFQFTMTFDEAQAKREWVHGSAPWPPAEASEAGDSGG